MSENKIMRFLSTVPLRSDKSRSWTLISLYPQWQARLLGQERSRARACHVTNVVSLLSHRVLKARRARLAAQVYRVLVGLKVPRWVFRFLVVDLKITATGEYEHSSEFDLQGPPGPAGPEGKQVSRAKVKTCTSGLSCVLISGPVWFHRVFLAELEIVASRATRWGPKPAPAGHFWS